MGSSCAHTTIAGTALRKSGRQHCPTKRALEGSKGPRLTEKASGKTSPKSSSTLSGNEAGKKDSKQRVIFKIPAWAWQAAAVRSAVDTWKKEEEQVVSSIPTDHGRHKNKQLLKEHCSECLLQMHGGKELEAASILMEMRLGK
jgi:hypothetical protein